MNSIIYPSLITVGLAGLFMFGLFAFMHIARMQRMRFDWEREKDEREEVRNRNADERARAEEERLRREEGWRRASFGAQNFYYLADHVEADPTATGGDYITIKFDLGSQATAGTFADAVYSALELPGNLAVMGGYDADDVHVRVHRASYENPLTVILLIVGGAAALAYVMKKARQSSDDLQAIRAATSEANAQVAADNLQKKLIERVSSALEAADDAERSRILTSVVEVARAVTEHNLLEMRPQHVGSDNRVQDSLTQRLKAAPPPREIGPGSSSTAE